MAGKHRSASSAEIEVRFSIRLPRALRDHLSDTADARGKSLNAEIVERLVRPYTSEEYETAHEVYANALLEKYQGWDRPAILSLEPSVDDPRSDYALALQYGRVKGDPEPEIIQRHATPEDYEDLIIDWIPGSVGKLWQPIPTPDRPLDEKVAEFERIVGRPIQR